jgi:hypothetical protein
MTEFSEDERRLVIRALRLVVSTPKRTQLERIHPTMLLLTRLRAEWDIAVGDES